MDNSDWKPMFDIRVAEEAIFGDLMTYRSQGRILLNGIEAKNFKEHLEEHHWHQLYYMFVKEHMLTKRDFLDVTRGAAKTIHGHPYVTSGKSMKEIHDTLRDIFQWNGLMGSNCVGSLRDGFLVLTDESTIILKRVARKRKEWERAKKKAKFLSTVRDLSEVPVILDPSLVAEYFTNTSFRQEIRLIRPERRKTISTNNGLQMPKKTAPKMESVDDKLASVRNEIAEYRDRTQEIVDGPQLNRDSIVKNLKIKLEELDAIISEINCSVEQSKQERIPETRYLEIQLDRSNRIQERLKSDTVVLRAAINRKDIEHQEASAAIKIGLGNVTEKDTEISDRALENETGLCKTMNSRIIKSLPVIAKAEFQRDCELKLKCGNFKFADLKNAVIQIALELLNLEEAAAKINSTGGQRHGTMTSKGDATGSAGNIETMSEIYKGMRKNISSCFFCKKPGHLKKDCFKFKNFCAKRQTTNGSVKNREPKDSKDGRSPET